LYLLCSILFVTGFDEKDAEAAEREEEEARAIQKRLAEQLDEGDFLLDMFATVFISSSYSNRILHFILGGMLS
jgi:hypothetical protein